MSNKSHLTIQKYYWGKSNLSTAVFYNNALNIDSNYIRNSEDIKELKAVAYNRRIKRWKSIMKIKHIYGHSSAS
mgnify:CR=1 FL=1